MTRTLLRSGLSIVLAWLLCAGGSIAYAQGSTTSTITGTVVDSSGGVLPGATVTAKHLATGTVSTTTANSQGAFTIASVQPGTYEVSITLDGFKNHVVKNVVITAVQGPPSRPSSRSEVSQRP